MFFIILLALTTFCIAASAAFFSVFGLMQTYSAIAIYMLIAGASLELGKLVTASALYRMWDKLGLFLKSFLMFAVLALMAVTSLGIFGFLSAGYQKDSVPIAQINQKLDTDQQEIDRLISRKKEIDQQIAKLPSNYVSSRQKLMSSFEPELKAIGPRIDELQKEIADYQTKKIDTEAHIGPIIYVAKVLNRQPDEAVFWFTLLIMSVFDPLAVALTLATNIAIKNRKDSSEKKSVVENSNVEEKEIQITPEVNLPEDIVPESESSTSTLSKEDVVDIVKSAIENEDLQAQKNRSAILAELRK